MAYEYEEEVKSVIGTETVFSYEETEKEARVKELQEVYKKAKAFDTLLKYKQHVEKYNNSDCHELERVFESLMKEYEEDE